MTHETAEPARTAPLFYVRHDGIKAEGVFKVGDILSAHRLTFSHLLCLQRQVTEAIEQEARRLSIAERRDA